MPPRVETVRLRYAPCHLTLPRLSNLTRPDPTQPARSVYVFLLVFFFLGMFQWAIDVEAHAAHRRMALINVTIVFRSTRWHHVSPTLKQPDSCLMYPRLDLPVELYSITSAPKRNSQAYTPSNLTLAILLTLPGKPSRSTRTTMHD